MELKNVSRVLAIINFFTINKLFYSTSVRLTEALSCFVFSKIIYSFNVLTLFSVAKVALQKEFANTFSVLSSLRVLALHFSNVLITLREKQSLHYIAFLFAISSTEWNVVVHILPPSRCTDQRVY